MDYARGKHLYSGWPPLTRTKQPWPRLTKMVPGEALLVSLSSWCHGGSARGVSLCVESPVRRRFGVSDCSPTFLSLRTVSAVSTRFAILYPPDGAVAGAIGGGLRRRGARGVVPAGGTGKKRTNQRARNFTLRRRTELSARVYAAAVAGAPVKPPSPSLDGEGTPGSAALFHIT